ncbi:MAG: ABC transporter ATP-binding protein [archaeon GB-1867-035]|nr:ABC transporter ATP-binding protein [Candidatus Culexmicrobium profundum]
MTCNTVIHVENLTKKFGGFTVLNNVNLRVLDGEVFGVLGPNGAGKSTLIKLILGLLRPSSGFVRLFGLNMSVESERIRALRMVGYVPDYPFFPMQLNAFDILCFYGRLFGLEGVELKDRVFEILSFVGLRNRMFDKIGHYSRGMIKRLGLAQALINRPRLLIMDEPTSGLSPEITPVFRSYIKRIVGNGVTVFLSTNDVNEAEEVCSRVIVIHNGRIVGEWKSNGSISLREFYLEVIGIEDC